MTSGYLEAMSLVTPREESYAERGAGEVLTRDYLLVTGLTPASEFLDDLRSF